MSAIDHSRMIDGTCKMTIMTHGPWMTINGPCHVDNWCTFHLYEKVLCFERSPPMEVGWQEYVGEGHGSMEAPGDSAVRYRRGGHGGVWKHLWSWLLSIGGKGPWGNLGAPGELAVGYRWEEVMGESGRAWGVGCWV